MTKTDNSLVADNKEVSKFLKKVANTPIRNNSEAQGRLLFAMDATASREATWDRACHFQGQMFQATASIGELMVQLCYYRGFNEFKSSSWCRSAKSLLKKMNSVKCLGGHTQIAKIFDHAMNEHKLRTIRAIIFVGDALEENADYLCHKAGQLGVLNIPLFMFQEGDDEIVKSAYQQMAKLSGGAYSQFNLNSAGELRDLLSAVAVFAAGGKHALETISVNSSKVNLLTQQLRD